MEDENFETETATILDSDFLEEEETFEQALDNLVSSGHVYALCDTCLIPLDDTERKDSRCQGCGPIASIYYKLNDSANC